MNPQTKPVLQKPTIQEAKEKAKPLSLILESVYTPHCTFVMPQGVRITFKDWEYTAKSEYEAQDILRNYTNQIRRAQ